MYLLPRVIGAQQRFGAILRWLADLVLDLPCVRAPGTWNLTCYTSNMQSTDPNTRKPITPGGTPLIVPEPEMGNSARAAIPTLRQCDYQPCLATFELVTEIRALLAAERRAERLVCRYLADLADRIQAREGMELRAYDDEFDATRCLFGMGVRDTRERIRVGRALRNLPQIERAFIEGELCYSRVREVTRVATVASEPAWVELARELNMRSLERRVAAERKPNRARSSTRNQQWGDRHDQQWGDRHDQQWGDRRARTEWMGTDRVRVTFELSTNAWTLVERAMRGARRAGTAGSTDGDALEAVARAALSVQRPPASNFGTETTQGGSPQEGGVGPSDEGRPGPTATQLATPTTQGGSSDDPTHQRTDDRAVGTGFVEYAREPASRVLEVMGRAGGWTLDALTEASGLSAQEVCVAMTLLELGGHVGRHAFSFDPV